MLGLQGMPGTWCAVPVRTAPEGGEEVARERRPAGDGPTEVSRAWRRGLEGARKGARRAATGPAAHPAASSPRGRKLALPPPERQLRRLLESYRTFYGSFHYHWEAVCVGKEPAGPHACTPTAGACFCDGRAGGQGRDMNPPCAGVRAARSCRKENIQEGHWFQCVGHLTVLAIYRIAL